MKKITNLPPITVLLERWYDRHHRELPWRGTTDAYAIWISEIILQQTRVSQGMDYYLRFIRRFPDVKTLAEADEQEVLKLWQGLGYYSRARNLHTAARQIRSRFGGRFPSDYNDILSLKGIGTYTAAAVASIAFGAPYAVIDGNVLRVISRLFAIDTPINTAQGKKSIGAAAAVLLDRDHPGKFNQAMMDFGATLCIPTQPRCESCPVRDYCMAFSKKAVTAFPVKNRKGSIRERFFHYFHIVHRGVTYIRKRDRADIWKNLFEFPLIETEKEMAFSQLLRREDFQQLFSSLPLTAAAVVSLDHKLTHQLIHARFYRIILPNDATLELPEPILTIREEQLSEYPISRLTEKYLENI